MNERVRFIARLLDREKWLPYAPSSGFPAVSTVHAVLDRYHYMGTRLGAAQHRFEDVEEVMPSCMRIILYDDPMTERQPLRVDVDCYAGHRSEQTPRTLILGERRVDVAEVLDAWLAPDYRYFKLRGADGDSYLVRHDGRSDTWELTMFRAERVDRP